MAKSPARRPKKPPLIRVLLIDEYPLFSEALGTAIALEEDLEHVASATTADEAVELIAECAADVVVIDADLPPATSGTGLDGIDATRRLRAARPETRVLILTGTMDLDTMVRAASEGACGFLPKTSSLADICHAIRTARDGGMYVEQEFVATLVDRLRTTRRKAIAGGSARAVLTTREQEVLTLLGEGLDVTAIAKQLDIKLNTCRGHVKSLLVKLGSHSQLEAVVEAVHQGLLPHLSR
jgi:DNA-binding NarL/FixJ family response regulator